MTNLNVTFCVSRLSIPNPTALSSVVYHDVPNTLPPNHVLLRVDRFGFSTNNITYQNLGENPVFGYFDFYAPPTADNVAPETHGVIPVWGFGDVVASSHPNIQPGERVYGYLAPTRYLLLPISPSEVDERVCYVLRPNVPKDRLLYNEIIRCANDPMYDPSPANEDLYMVFRQMYLAGFWLEDCLFSSSYRNGANLIVISSASSKTAFGLAYRIQKRISKNEIPADVKVVGLTSKRNQAFTQGLGVYHETILYDDLNALAMYKDRKGIYVDVAGNKHVNNVLGLEHGSIFAVAIGVGGTSVSPKSRLNASKQQSTNSAQDTREESKGSLQFERFFVPAWIEKRESELGISQSMSIVQEAWEDLMKDGKDWMKIERVYGVEAVQKVYDDAVERGLKADKGYVFSLWDEVDQVP